MNSKKIGIFIKRLREERNISQQELANLISIDRSNISRWENGNSVPTLETMGSICKLFNIELAELIAGERRTYQNEQCHNDVITEYIKQTENKFKIKFIFSLVIIFIIMFLLLLYYFSWNFNSIEIYKFVGKSINYEITDGIMIINKETIYFKIGSIGDKSYDIKLIYTKDKKSTLLYDGNSNSVISDFSGYNSNFFMSHISDCLSNLSIILNDEEINLEFERQYRNNKIVLSKKTKIVSDNSLVEINNKIPNGVLNNFDCDGESCKLTKKNYDIFYNISARQFYILTKNDENILYDVDKNEFNYTNPDMSYIVIDNILKCNSTNCDNYEFSYTKYFINLIKDYLDF